VNSGVGSRVATDKVVVLTWSGRTTASDLDLCARRIKLSATGVVGKIVGLRLVVSYLYVLERYSLPLRG
jgi:hypothetical protein